MSDDLFAELRKTERNLPKIGKPENDRDRAALQLLEIFGWSVAQGGEFLDQCEPTEVELIANVRKFAEREGLPVHPVLVKITDAIADRISLESADSSDA